MKVTDGVSKVWSTRPNRKSSRNVFGSPSTAIAMMFVVTWLVVGVLYARLGGRVTKCGREPD